MRVINLVAENIKRLIAIDITPKDDMVVITGENGAGKSSVLDSIYFALGGKDVIDEEPLRKGTDKGSITVDLGEYIVTRTFNKKNTYLKIESKAGIKIESPQKLLDKIVGVVSFDPLEFINKPSPAEQRKILLTLVGADTDALDLKEKELREKRTVAGRYRDKASATVKSLPNYPEVSGMQVVSVSDLSKQLQADIAYNHAITQHTKLNERKKEAGQAKLSEHAAIEEQIKELRAKQATLSKEVDQLREAYRVEKGEIAKLTPLDVTILQTQIDSAEGINSKLRANEQYQIAKDEFDLNEKEYKDLTALIDQVMATRKSILESAPLPVTGLTVSDSGILYNGIPLAQASDGEKLMIGIGISMALNPTLRVIRIKDGSLLDTKNRALIRAMIKEKDFQVWLETVGSDATQGILIEEGKVAGTNPLDTVKANPVITEPVPIEPLPLPEPVGQVEPKSDDTGW